MKRFLRLAGAPLALLSLFLLSASSVGGADPSAITLAAGGPSGSVHGQFNLPDRQTPGLMRGDLDGRGGRAFISIDASVLRNAPSGMGGEIRGRARVRRGPLQGTSALVHGLWTSTAPGQGRLQAVVFVPPDPTTGRPRRVLAMLRGSFVDPDGPAGPRGAFRGHWRR